jgi:hypothetical protein
MALILNREFETDNGLKVAEGTYLRVEEVYISREKGVAQVGIQTFVNKEARFTNKKPYTIAGFNNVIQVPLTFEESIEAGLYDTLYSKVKESLISTLGEDGVADDLEVVGNAPVAEETETKEAE